MDVEDRDEQVPDLIEADNGEEPASDAIMEKSPNVLRKEWESPTGLQE